MIHIQRYTRYLEPHLNMFASATASFWAKVTELFSLFCSTFIQLCVVLLHSTSVSSLWCMKQSCSSFSQCYLCSVLMYITLLPVYFSVYPATHSDFITFWLGLLDFLYANTNKEQGNKWLSHSTPHLHYSPQQSFSIPTTSLPMTTVLRRPTSPWLPCFSSVYYSRHSFFFLLHDFTLSILNICTPKEDIIIN